VVEEEEENDDNEEEDRDTGKRLGNRLKTKHIVKILEENDWRKVVFVDKNEFASEFKKATANIPKTGFYRSSSLNVYDLLKYETVVFSKEGLEEVQDRLNEEKQKARKLAKRALL